MKQSQSRMLSFLLILAMVFTFIPTGLVQASGEYFTFTSFSTQEADPTQVNQKFVDLVGTFNGVSSSSISYKVEQIVNGQAVGGSKGMSSAPIIENGSTFKFLNVEMSPGLNRITVSGQNSSGNNVTGVCYVNYSNVPVIYDLKDVNSGKALEAGSPLIVNTNKATIMLKAPNAKQVTINGVAAFSAGENSFILNDIVLTPGLNKLAIVASNETYTYTLERELVYYSTYPTGYNLAIAPTNSVSDPGKIMLEGNPSVGPNVINADPLLNQLQGYLSGLIVFRRETAPVPPDPNISLNVSDPNGVVTSLPTTVTARPDLSDAAHIVFQYVTTAPHSFTIDGRQRVIVVGLYGATQNSNFTYFFNYRNTNSPYFSGEIRQLYGMSGAGPVTYSSSIAVAQNSMVFELPIWLEAQVRNATAGTVVELTTTVGSGAPMGNGGAFTYQEFTTAAGNKQFKITNLPAGEQTLRFSIRPCAACSVSDSKTWKINYVPAPSIQLSNIFNTKIFSGNAPDAEIITPPATPNPKLFSTVKGRLVNFNTISGDQNTVKVKVNGTEVLLRDYGTIDPATGFFEFRPVANAVPGTVDRNLQLVSGPNLITISGTANGVPVSTSMTVYLFSENVPVITGVKPVPYVNGTTFLTDDPEQRFKPSGTNAYATNERSSDVLFTVQNVSKVIVSVDGNQKVVAEWDNDTNASNPVDCSGGCSLVSRDTTLLIVDPQADPSIPRFSLRYRKNDLPRTGSQSIVIQLAFGSASVSHTMTITRELLPFDILSPKLPNERVINQNFLPIAIRAEGAEAILVGKDPMKKEAGDIFRYELSDLKVGVNKVKFTVMRGTEKLDGEFEVNYTGSSALGAQFKAQIPAGGQVQVFNKELTLKFPKGTMLRPSNLNPGQDYDEVDLFDKQKLMFGIADRQDGRTVKRYNDGFGTLSDVPQAQIAQDLLVSKPHFGYASQLFWIDAGYFKRSTQFNTYETVPAMPPMYMEYDQATNTSNLRMFFSRTGDQWMDTSQRGTITIKYDGNIRNGASPKLSIMKFDGNQWKNLGGVVDTAKGEITTSFDGFGYYAAFTETYSYNDIAGHPFARDQLELMHAKGYMLPKDNNEFGVYDNITRGEFATMVVKLLDLPLQYDPANPTYSDVPRVSLPGAGGLWDYRYIETAARLGIVRGTAPRLFNPGGSISREQAAVMIANALELKLQTPEQSAPALAKAFTDSGTVEYYAIAPVLAIQKAGLITGRPNELTGTGGKLTYRFDPKAFMNRAEAAVIAQRILKNAKRL